MVSCVNVFFVLVEVLLGDGVGYLCNEFGGFNLGYCRVALVIVI